MERRSTYRYKVIECLFSIMFNSYFAVLFAYALFGACQSSTLVVNVAEVRATEDVNLAFTVSSSTNLTRWTKAGSRVASLMSYQNGTCTTSPSYSFLGDSSRYSYACNRTIHQITVLNAGQNINNEIFVCKDALLPESSGSTWLIKVVSDNLCTECRPQITFHVEDITEGDNVTFICRVPSDVTFVNWDMNFGSNTSTMSGQNGLCTTQGTTFLDDTSKYIYTCNRTVFQVTRLNIQRYEHNDMYMCKPSAMQEGIGSNWIIKVKASAISISIMEPYLDQVDVVENTPVTLRCKTSEARPPVSVYWYKHPNGNSNDVTQITENITSTTGYSDFTKTWSTLHFFTTRQDNNMKLFCEASNSVNKSPVKSNTEKMLNVLFPPTVARMKNISKHIDDELKVNCLYTAGVPAQTSVRWTRDIDITQWEGYQLYILSIKRSDAGYYFCNASNVMKPSDNSNLYIGHSTESFYLDVLYDAYIIVFAIDGFTKHVATVNENDPVRFICNADSNPEAIMTLTHDGKPVKMKTSNALEYNIAKGTCLDAGLYICHAMNAYNSVVSSVEFVQLFVTCHPRAVKDVDMNIKSDTGASITIAVEVIAYPSPIFKWYKLVNGTWALLKENGIYSMTSSGVKSNFTIHSVGVDDFTSYKVIVENDHGHFEQYYSMTPYDKPNPPINFRYIEGHTTISSIYLEWEPGFDGGLSQTFYIKYKKSSDSYWKYVKVSDNEEQKMDLSLTGLTEVTQYDIVIFASNREGNSSESQKLIAVTNGDCSCTSPGLLIGGIISLTVGIAVLVAVGVFVFRRNGFINACSKKSAIKTGEDKGINNTAEETSYNNITSDPEYEMMDQRNSESAQRSSLEQIQLTAASGNRLEERKDAYENLKVEVF